jgi:hypothetical protein
MLVSLIALFLSQTPPPLDRLLLSTAGRWQGELQYRDYQSNQWQGLPVTVSVVAQPDGVTLVRTAAYDDGPATGTVHITTLSHLDVARGVQSYTGARKGRAIDSGEAKLRIAAYRDDTHWTIVGEERRRDGDGMALVRETTTCDGDTLTTLKEVDPEGDGQAGFLPRNRTILRRAA